MDKSAVIETPRLRIVPFSEEHLCRRYVDWLNDPIVVRYSEQRHYTHTLKSCRQYWMSFLDSPNYFWAILLREGAPSHIGNLSARVDIYNRVADLAILIGERSAWHRGYGLEAWSAGCRFLLHVAGLRKVTGGALAANKAMLSIMRHAGMIEECRRLKQFLFEGSEVDSIYYALYSHHLAPFS